MRMRLAFGVWGLGAVWGGLLLPAQERLRLAEPWTDLRVFQVMTQVRTQGKLTTPAGSGQTRDLALESTAQFAFRERRLPPAGRDAAAFRALREFDVARMQATVEKEPTHLALPEASRLVVAAGQREGILSYSLRTLLTRDLVDLLNLPADPLALSALLPSTPVGVGEEWAVPEWAAQMFAGIEAVETARLMGRLLAVEEGIARLELRGAVQGLQEGTRTTITIEAEATFDVAAQHLRGARVVSRIQSDIGAVTPGIDAAVTVQVERRVAPQAGGITDTLVESIPLDPPPEALKLTFDAAPWKARLRHDRHWYVFHAVLDAPPKVVILRLVERGSLICQCNFSPIPDAPPGEHTPLGEYERDIRTALGKALRGITRQEVTSLPEGRTLVEVVAEGEVEVAGKGRDGASAVVVIPMEWHYYIIADPRGRQMSFVFAVEKALVEQLAGRDRELVTSLEFLGSP
jgi:hypothetical protein